MIETDNAVMPSEMSEAYESAESEPKEITELFSRWQEVGITDTGFFKTLAEQENSSKILEALVMSELEEMYIEAEMSDEPTRVFIAVLLKSILKDLQGSRQVKIPTIEAIRRELGGFFNKQTQEEKMLDSYVGAYAKVYADILENGRAEHQPCDYFGQGENYKNIRDTLTDRFVQSNRGNNEELKEKANSFFYYGYMQSGKPTQASQYFGGSASRERYERWCKTGADILEGSTCFLAEVNSRAFIAAAKQHLHKERLRAYEAKGKTYKDYIRDLCRNSGMMREEPKG